MSRWLDGRTVLVTGGGRGIGREHCIELARHGARVAIMDPGVDLAGRSADADDPAESVADEVRALGSEALVVRASVTDWDAVASAIDSVLATFGSVDVAVNNAGIVRDQTIAKATLEDFSAVIDVHLNGTFIVTRHLCAYWKQQASDGRFEGRIINTTSGAGLYGNFGQAAYAAAKAGIVALTQVTALEMRKYGVTANAISPVAATRMTASAGLASAAGSGDDDYDPFHPRVASPLVAYLASTASGWLNGQVLRLDQGRLCRMQPWSVAEIHTPRSGSWLTVDEISDVLPQMFGTQPRGLAQAQHGGS